MKGQNEGREGEVKHPQFKTPLLPTADMSIQAYYF